MTIEDRARRILALILEVDADRVPSLTRESEPKWDSLKHVEIIFAMEDEFGIQLDESQMTAIGSLADMVAAVKAAGG